VRLLHAVSRTHASFDDGNLVSRAGLVPVLALAERAGLQELAARHVRPGGPCGVNAAAKISCLVAGMAAGADSIDDLGLLRHGAMAALFAGIRAPSTLGSHLRAYTWGHVAQLEKVHRLLLAELARQAPLLPGAQVLAFVDIDSSQKRVFGYKKQGARFGYTKIAGRQLAVRGLNPLVAAISTPLAAPVIAATRLRGGNAHSVRGAASFAAGAVRTARGCGCTAMIIVRMDSAYYAAGVLHAIRRAGARFSVTVPHNTHLAAAIAAVPADAWTPVRYPRALWDDQLGCWVSEAEVAETGYTAFAGNPVRAWQHDTVRPMDGRLIIRRVRDQNAAAGQGELFPAWRYHAVFTDSPFDTLQAEDQHRDHAVIEQVLADIYAGPLAHLPSGKFAANAAWLTCAAIAHNLLRAAGTLAGRRYARARGATIRRDLIALAARTARHGRSRITLHLPAGWHREHEWLTLFTTTCGPPAAPA